MIYDLYILYTKGDTYLHRSCFTFQSFIDIMLDRRSFSAHYVTGQKSYNVPFSEALGLSQIFVGKVKHTPNGIQFGECSKL